MTTPSAEPMVAEWVTTTATGLLERIGGLSGADSPVVVAVDGRSASGKTTLAAALFRDAPDAAIVHTDDLAWHEPFFEWGHLLRAVLTPVRSGQGVAFRPPAWEARGRQGSIDVPAGRRFVIVEGVGAAQLEVADLIDVTVWVLSEAGEAHRRGIARDVAQGDRLSPEEAEAFWQEWMSHETPFLARDRPWERAAFFVAGSGIASVPAGWFAVAESGRPPSVALH